jgi:DNA-binding NtrC family response regulator
MTGSGESAKRYENIFSKDIVVLHVDDDSAWLEVTKESLETDCEFIDIITTDSASAALSQLEDLPDHFDCVVTDQKMPGMTGIELVKAIRERGLRIPTVLYTSCGNNGIATKAIEAGAVEYVQKSAGTDHYVLLANRIVSAVARHQFQE